MSATLPWVVKVEGVETASALDVNAAYAEFYRVAGENPEKWIGIHRPDGTLSAARARDGRYL